MIQSTSSKRAFDGLHVAVIMDGNGRWALSRGEKRSHGHKRGQRSVRDTVEEACRLGLGTLTLYAFSSDNWQRPAEEVRTLMQLFESYLTIESWTCRTHGVRVNVIGRRDRLSSSLLSSIGSAEDLTSRCSHLHLRIAVDYSARGAILGASALPPCRTPTEFSVRLNQAIHSNPVAPDVDLLIRTGGTQRLSDFLLWECAYAEIFFTERMWPDFRASDLEDAVQEFYRRERRFGQVPAPRAACGE